jgi:hypothetical protein
MEIAIFKGAYRKKDKCLNCKEEMLSELEIHKSILNLPIILPSIAKGFEWLTKNGIPNEDHLFRRSKNVPPEAYEALCLLGFPKACLKIKKSVIPNGGYPLTDILECGNCARYHCRECSNLDIYSHLKISKAPSFLILSLDRLFSFGDTRKTKEALEKSTFNIALPVYFSLEQTEIFGSTYELLAVVVFNGKTPLSGHYVTYTKKRGQWIEFDDDKVSKRVSKNVYLMLFQKI